jgi:hypothetical protein
LGKQQTTRINPLAFHLIRTVRTLEMHVQKPVQKYDSFAADFRAFGPSVEAFKNQLFTELC